MTGEAWGLEGAAAARFDSSRVGGVPALVGGAVPGSLPLQS